MLAILKKELSSYFHSMLGWLFLALNLFFAGWNFRYYGMTAGYPYVSYVISGILMIFLLSIPILTMRVFSEESRTKTDQLLYTSPVPIWKIILGKYLALAVIFVMLIAWHTTLQPLVNSLSFKLQETGINVSFGLARSVGSFLYAVLMAVLGILVEKKGVSVLPITAEVAMAMLLVSLAVTKHHSDKAKAANHSISDRRLSGAEAAAAEDTCEPDEEINLIEFIKRNKVFFLLNILSNSVNNRHKRS